MQFAIRSFSLVIVIGAVIHIGAMGADADSSTLYSWLHNVNVRDKPGMKSRTIGRLKEGEAVTSLNERSSFSTKLTLRCRELNTPWLKIRLHTGTVGWVYEGALRADRVTPVPWKVILAYFPGKPEEASEDWSWFFDEISRACANKGIYAVHVVKGDACVPLGEAPNYVGSVNLEKLVQKHAITGSCYILLQHNKQPEIVEYQPPAGVLDAASKYFKVNLQ
jgi:hypothetical protein